MICAVKSTRIVNATLFTVTLFPNAVYHVVAVIPRLKSRVRFTALYDKTMKNIAEDAIALIELALMKEHVLAIRKVVLEGDPAKKLVEYAEANPIDLIVMSSAKSETPPPEIVGSTARKVLSKTSKPVLIYTPLSAPPHKVGKLLLVFNKASHLDIDKIIDIAETITMAHRGVKITALVIGDPAHVKEKLEEKKLSYDLIDHTSSYEEVVEYTKDTDLVIVNKTKSFEEKIPLLRKHVTTLTRMLAGLSFSPVIVV